jgi:hypothetical protein
MRPCVPTLPISAATTQVESPGLTRAEAGVHSGLRNKPMLDEARKPEVIETRASQASAEVARRGVDPYDRVTITIEPDELIPGRRLARPGHCRRSHRRRH